MSIDNVRESGDLPMPAGRAAIPTPIFDPAEYLDEMAELGLSDEQATEILGILWQITGFFARTGFEVDVCGLIFQDFNEASAPSADDGRLDHSTSQETPSDGNGKERAT